MFYTFLYILFYSYFSLICIYLCFLYLYAHIYHNFYIYVYECNSVYLYIFLHIFVLCLYYIYYCMCTNIYVSLYFCVSACPFLPRPHCDVTIEIASQWLLWVAKANKHFFILHSRKLTAATFVMFYV